MESRNETILITHFDEIEESKTQWKKFFGLGIVMMILGLFAMSAAPFLTLFSVMLVGVLLLAGGVSQIVHSFLAKKWSGFFLSLLVGILYSVVGLISIAKPHISAAGITLLMGSLLLIGGLFRAINALVLRFRQWGWALFHGTVTLLLGLLILSEWPYSGLWIIGLFIGIDLFLTGWFCTTLSLAARKKA